MSNLVMHSLVRTRQRLELSRSGCTRDLRTEWVYSVHPQGSVRKQRVA